MASAKIQETWCTCLWFLPISPLIGCYVTGREIEPNFIAIEYGEGVLRKRFFDETSLQALFHDWQLVHLLESRFEYHGKQKVAWELVADRR